MKNIFILIAMLFAGLNSFSQSRVVTGKVVDITGKPVPFASITIKGTKTGVQASMLGEFSIHAKPSDILVVSIIGFTSKEVAVGNNRQITVILDPAENTLMEVVVTSAFSISKRSMSSYSYTTVTSDALQGKVSGINVQNGKKIGFKTWKRSGIEENSVRLSVGDNDYIPLKNVQVAVQVDGFRARVLFDYFFYSNKDKQLRGDFKLKLPTGASPCYFAFGNTEYFNKDKNIQSVPFVYYPSAGLNLIKDTIRSQRNNKWSNTKEAIVAPKEKAAYAFNEVVRGSIDPALLEWAGADVFSCSVYPIQKNKLERIVIGYDINLQEMDSDAVFDLLLPYDDKIEKKLDIDIANTDGQEEQVEPSITDKKNINGRTRYHLENFPEKNFTISLRSKTPAFIRNSSNENYFAVTYQPRVPSSRTAAVSGDAIFLLDVSLSSKPDKFNVWLRTMDGILKNNRKQINRFAVLLFNVEASWWRESYSWNKDYNVDSFMNFASNLSLLGATDLGNALKAAAHPSWLRNETSGKTIFLLSDGDASWGEDNLFQLSGVIPPQDKIFTFTTGFSGTDTRVLDHLSRQTNGAVFSVLNEDEVDKASVAIQSLPWRIREISMNGAKDILMAGRPYFVFAGQKLLITGRGKIDRNSIVKLTLEQGSDIRTYEIPAEQIIESGLTNRVYGQVAVNQLEDFSFKTEDASIKYATHYEIPGKSCSLLMLDSKQLYERFGLDSLKTQHFIDSNLVTDIVSKVLNDEAANKSLGSAKADMDAWLKKMKKDNVLDLVPDNLFEQRFKSLPEQAFRVDVRPINAGNILNEQWYVGTLNELNQSVLDYNKLIHMISMEKKMEGKGNAFKLISSFAESNGGDMTLLRDVAYVISNWNLDGKAYELLKRIMHARPAEPPTYTLIANSLVKLNKIDLAMLYYDIAFLTKWDDRFEGFDVISALQYSRLLHDVQNGKYIVADTGFVNQRMADVTDFLKENNIPPTDADLVIMITWNTDNTDVDLHVLEPSKEECYYGHSKTASGGFITDDATEGFGPEMYFLQKAPKGKYHVDVEYFRSSNVRTSSKSKVVVDAYKNWGRPNEEHFQKIVELKKSEGKRNVKREEVEDDDKRLNDIFVIDL